MSKDLDEMMREMMKSDYTTKARDQGTIPLTAETLRDTVCMVKRAEGRFIVIDANYIPDDVYGIIYLRPEDSAKLKEAHALRASDRSEK